MEKRSLPLLDEMFGRMCGCECHDPGKKILHCMPCCDFTYEKRTDEQQRKVDIVRKHEFRSHNPNFHL